MSTSRGGRRPRRRRKRRTGCSGRCYICQPSRVERAAEAKRIAARELAGEAEAIDAPWFGRPAVRP